VVMTVTVEGSVSPVGCRGNLYCVAGELVRPLVSFTGVCVCVGKGGNVRQHCKGCNCKRSGCLKNYCECYEVSFCMCWLETWLGNG